MHHNHYQVEPDAKAYDSRQVRQLMIYLKPYRWQVIGSLALLVLASFIGLLTPYLIKVSIDDYIQPGRVEELYKIALILLGVLTAEFALRYAQINLMAFVAQRMMHDLRMDIFRRFHDLPVAFFDNQTVGGLMSRIIGDVNVLYDLFTAGVVTMLGDLLVIGGIMISMLLLDSRLALAVFAVLPLMFYITYWFRKKVRNSFREVRKRAAAISGHLQESLVGMSVIQIFNRQKARRHRFDQLNHDHLDAFLATIRYYAIFYPLIEISSSLAIALIIWYGGGEILTGAVTFGILVAFVEYTGRFFRPVFDLAEKYNILQAAMAASERIFGLIDTEPGTKNLPDAALFEGLSRELEFKNVRFCYKPEEPVLKGVSFKVKKGESVAVVGLTGAGKSTVINLLTRFYEVEAGEILFDGINIRKLDRFSLRCRVGLVLQDPFIFSGTVEENISLGREEINRERVEEAARTVNAHRFIEKLPGGYGFELAERGAQLSSGQRQLISFARALAGNPGILILDEATSDIDTKTETLIQAALSRMRRGRTFVIIAHRLSTIKEVDRIIVLDHGLVKETGTHRELLALKGIYYKLYSIQYQS
ncbi:MAG: ABC transporter ATP-binding protein [bacterium]